jgi:hypothetical protein
LQVPAPIKGCPFVWIASVKLASPLHKRTSQLSFVNAGPAGSRAGEWWIELEGVLKSVTYNSLMYIMMILTIIIITIIVFNRTGKA